MRQMHCADHACVTRESPGRKPAQEHTGLPTQCLLSLARTCNDPGGKEQVTTSFLFVWPFLMSWTDAAGAHTAVDTRGRNTHTQREGEEANESHAGPTDFCLARRQHKTKRDVVECGGKNSYSSFMPIVGVIHP